MVIIKIHVQPGAFCDKTMALAKIIYQDFLLMLQM